MKLLFPVFVSAIIFALHLLAETATCNSNEYCPLGWSVKRRDDGSVHTCTPHSQDHRCPKPYMCVASRCGINFCCINDKMLNRIKEVEEEEQDAGEDSDEENQEL